MNRRFILSVIVFLGIFSCSDESKNQGPTTSSPTIENPSLETIELSETVTIEAFMGAEGNLLEKGQFQFKKGYSLDLEVASKVAIDVQSYSKICGDDDVKADGPVK